MNPLCIYHGNCADGFGAAWVVRRALGFAVDFHILKTSKQQQSRFNGLLVQVLERELQSVGFFLGVLKGLGQRLTLGFVLSQYQARDLINLLSIRAHTSVLQKRLLKS